MDRVKLFLLVLMGLVWTGYSWGEETEKKLGPNHDLFVGLQKMWMDKDVQKLQELLDERILLNIGKLQGSRLKFQDRFYKEQAVGILKSYFSSIHIVKFEYDPKKMELARGVAIYEYQVIATGVNRKEMLYFYLAEKKKEDKNVWLLVGINEI